MDALEAKKNEGNALFQQKRFVEAVHIYSSVLDRLHSSKANDNEAIVRLETAVRLNRAWAWIQMPDSEDSESSLAAAELDCSAVIEKDPCCIKAFYRRALARERRGHRELAMEDAAVMKRLEPTNPTIVPLCERLQQNSQEGEGLTPKLQRCTINNGGNASTTSEPSDVALAHEAEDAWRALQADEMSLKRVHQTAVKRSTSRQKERKVSQNATSTKGEISHKTEDLWESLRREEITTVAKAFPKRKGGRVT